MLVSNTFVQIGSNPPPADVYIAYDQYLDVVYLTNKTGYYHGLSSSALGSHGYYVDFTFEDMAASFTIGANTNSISENDSYDSLWVFDLLDSDGDEYYAAANYGIGKIHFSSSSTKVSMTLTGDGPDYGQLDSSYDGTSRLHFVFSGSCCGCGMEWAVLGLVGIILLF